MAQHMATIIESIRAEYLRYRALAEAAIAQVHDNELSAEGTKGVNSIAVICWHIAGNFQSRFTDFLTTDGEKPWRQREEEFQTRIVTREELFSKWCKTGVGLQPRDPPAERTQLKVGTRAVGRSLDRNRRQDARGVFQATQAEQCGGTQKPPREPSHQ